MRLLQRSEGGLGAYYLVSRYVGDSMAGYAAGGFECLATCISYRQLDLFDLFLGGSTRPDVLR